MRSYPYWVEDPGHSWLAVPVSEVLESGAIISSYSYTDGAIAYLEEDCDAGAYLQAVGELPQGFPVESCNRDAFVRSLPSWPQLEVVLGSLA